MFDETGDRRKLIVFTEHRDTLNYLADPHRARSSAAPRPSSTIHGGVTREERREAQEAFIKDPDVSCSSRPTPPARASTSSGRTCSSTTTCPGTRTGSSSASAASTASARPRSATCGTSSHAETREGQVFQRLLEKLERQSKALGGQVFDVLGDASSRTAAARPADRGGPLRRPARGARAARRGRRRGGRRDAPRAPARARARHRRPERGRRRGDPARMEEAEARKLQPHYIRSFFLEAFRLARRPDRAARARPLRDHERPRRDPRPRQTLGAGGRSCRRYERVTFEKELVVVHGHAAGRAPRSRAPAARRDVDLVLERYRPLLKPGAVLVADADASEEPRALVYLEHAIQNAQRADRRTAPGRLQAPPVRRARCGLGRASPATRPTSTTARSTRGARARWPTLIDAVARARRREGGRSTTRSRRPSPSTSPRSRADATRVDRTTRPSSAG